MNAPVGDQSTLSSSLADASNVLLLVPSFDPHDDEGCMDLLTPVDPADENFLCLTFTKSPDNRIDAWRTHVGDELPAKSVFIHTGDSTRAAAAADTATSANGSIVIETVASPGDLTNVGVEVSNHLSSWSDDPNRIVACIHGLTSMLQYVELQAAYRFLHVLTGQLRSIGAFAHFHVDPTAHDEQTLNTLKTLFDAVVELDDGGDWVISSNTLSA